MSGLLSNLAWLCQVAKVHSHCPCWAGVFSHALAQAQASLAGWESSLPENLGWAEGCEGKCSGSGQDAWILHVPQHRLLQHSHSLFWLRGDRAAIPNQDETPPTMSPLTVDT